MSVSFAARRTLPAFLALFLAASATAQQHSFRHYGTPEGLQNLVVLSLAQDGAGFIWAGTEGGLYQYDGTRYRLMGRAEGLPCTTEVHTLYSASDGAVWVNICNHVFRFDGQRFHAVRGLEGMLRGAQGLAEAAPGRIVVASATGLFDVVQSAVDALSARAHPLPAPFAGAPMHGITKSGSALWFGCGGGLCVEELGRVTSFGPADGLPEDSWDGVRVAGDGVVWVRSSSRLYRKSPDAHRFVPEPASLPPSMFWGAVATGRSGTLMVPTDQGLAIREANGWTVIGRRRGLPSAMTSAVLEDRDGSVWVGLTGAGVARWLGSGEWQAWRETDGLPSDLVWNILRDRRGDLWVGTSLGVARLGPSGALRTWTRADGLGGDNVRWLGETADGAIWVLTRPGALARLDAEKGRIRRVGADDGLACESKYRGLVDRLGRLWMATSCGIYRNDSPAADGRFVRIDQPPAIQRGAWSVAEDARGRVWVTTPTGLWRLQEGQWREFRKADGLLNDNPYIVVIGPDGALWIRHRFDANIERVEVDGDRIAKASLVFQTAPQSTDVTALHGFDAQGRFWRGGANGVSVLVDGTWTTFAVEDGLVWNDCDGEAFWADADGSVWFGTSGGLAHYRPRTAVGPDVPAADPVISRIEISEHPRAVRAEYSSLNYKNEQVTRFAYRLDGGAWVDTADRVLSIAGLSAGRHRLEVRSAVRSGPLSAKIAVAEFDMAPVWWEMWWARVAMLALCLASLWGVTRWRHRVLERRNLQLQRAVRERTAQLEAERAKVLEEKKRADDANEAKSRFLAHTSHEIRTPLNGVIGLTRLLEDMPPGPEVEETIRLIRSSGEMLLHVINDILDFSKIEAGKIELERVPFQLRPCIEESVGLFRAIATQKHVGLACELAPDLPTWVAGDATRLRQVILNLVSNALKFTSEGEVRLSAAVEACGAGASRLAFDVRDTGIGVAPDRLARLFSSFSQADASISRRYGGTGLGLAIASRLVELQGGAISVESEPGRGTRFHFTVTLDVVEEPVLPPVETPSVERPRDLRVLVAEDNAVNQRVAIKLLARLGVDADLAADGAQAIEAVRTGRYDLVLMDVEMPGVDGLEATRTIRSQMAAGGQPVIVGLTAHATTEYREVCLAAGMNAYLTKPLEPERLRDLVEALSRPDGSDPAGSGHRPEVQPVARPAERPAEPA